MRIEKLNKDKIKVTLTTAELINLDIDVSVKCNGVYSYKITNPLLFYANVCGNVTSEYKRSEIESQLKTEFISALQPAFGRLSTLKLRPNDIPYHTDELKEAVNATLNKEWIETRGITVASIALNPVSLPEEDAELIKKAQHAAILRDPSMAAATLTGAQAEAMKAAAANENGAMMGFMGLGMAQQAGGANNLQNLYAMGQEQRAQAASAASWKCACGATTEGKFCPECGAKKPEPRQAGGWTCKCGAQANGNFCPECGAPRPNDNGWTCACGAVNKGRFCQNCGAKKPDGSPLYRCDKCGWEPEDPKNPPKFCPECGDIFNENDVK